MNIIYKYLGLDEYPVSDKNSLYKSGAKKVDKVRSLINISKQLFIASDNNIKLSILGEDKNIYKITIIDELKKRLIVTLYYIPNDNRLDLWNPNEDKPIFVWKNKICILKNISEYLKKVNVEKLFSQLISIL